IDDLVELGGAIEGDNQVLQFGVETGRCGSASRTGAGRRTCNYLTRGRREPRAAFGGTDAAFIASIR
ncbi:hypothetical protein KGP93_36035, partial [Burkholderia multivorans]|nr:hypothetical protein [Burkholderia multivorans]